MYTQNVIRNSSAVVESKTTLNQSNSQVQQPWLFLWLGHVLLGLGFIGVFLPLLPTTVFWIGAALCYAKSSPERYHRLLGHSHAGEAIKDFLDHGVISRKGKWAAVLGMSAAAIIIVLLDNGLLFTSLSLMIIAAGAAYVLTRPSQVSNEKS